MDASPAPFRLVSEELGAMPIIGHLLSRMDAVGLLDAYVPSDGQVKLSHATSLGIVISSLAVDHQPLYGLRDWLSGKDASCFGLAPGEVRFVNDDRIGRALDRLFDADRATMLNNLVLRCIDTFSIDCSQLHNDSTSVKVTGAPSPTKGRSKKAVALVRGHSKDHRPDLRQLVYILTISADGAVPVACRIADGNTEDSTTHIETWNKLSALLGRTDFVYVADSKLAVSDTMRYIIAHHGRFVSVLPKTRSEDARFREYLVDHVPDWEEARRVVRRMTELDDVYETTEAPWPSAEGFRVVWVRSSAKVERDAEARARKIADALRALEELNGRLMSPKTRTRTEVAAHLAGLQAVAEAGASRWVSTEVDTVTTVRHRQETRGRPGANTRYRRIETTRYQVRSVIDDTLVATDACSDGCWPIVTSERAMSAKEVLRIYKYQPHLERRNHILKGPLEVAPIFLHDTGRIEALMTCHFIALMVQALVEREIRRAMDEQHLGDLPIYPEGRPSVSPSALMIFALFKGVARRHLIDEEDNLVQTFAPELDKTQSLVLDLLGIPAASYA